MQVTIRHIIYWTFYNVVLAYRSSGRGTFPAGPGKCAALVLARAASPGGGRALDGAFRRGDGRDREDDLLVPPLC